MSLGYTENQSGLQPGKNKRHTEKNNEWLRHVQHERAQGLLTKENRLKEYP